MTKPKHKGDTMQTKYKVGDTVIYNRGSSAEKVGLSRTVEATIKAVRTEYSKNIQYSSPLYTIKWPRKVRRPYLKVT